MKIAVAGMAVTAIPISAMLVHLLMAYLNFYRNYEIVSSSKSIDIPVESLKETYDFIVIGGGSAGTITK